jgi:large subunit ribosomal protein L9
MSKTEVILIQNIVGLGAESDHVKVAAGYARNYLMPHGLAIPVTAANKKRLESLRKRRAEREAHDLNTMTELAASIGKLVCKITVKSGDDGRMFGAVTSGTIVDELKTQFAIALDKKKIHLEQPIRTLGEHEIELRLHPDVNAKLKVLIESSSPPPVEEPAKEAAARLGDNRGRRFERPMRGAAPERPAEAAPRAKPAGDKKAK